MLATTLAERETARMQEPTSRLRQQSATWDGALRLPDSTLLIFEVKSRAVELVAPVARQQELGNAEAATLASIKLALEADKVALARRLVRAALNRGAGGEELLRLARVLSPLGVKRSRRTDVQRARDFDFLRRSAAELHGKWVALDSGKLVASATTLGALQARIAQLGLSRPPLIHHVNGGGG